MLKVIAHSKINLFLNILDRRPDGYHNIETILQSISLANYLTFTPTEKETAIVYKNVPVTDFQGDLVAKATQVIKEETGLTQQTLIEVKKQTPVAAGLGGGSADAAATLVGLNHIYNLDLKRDSLLEMAEKIGSDVPFFIYGGTQQAEGRGEKLTKLDSMPDCWIVVATPPFEISTSRAYEDFDRLEKPLRRNPAAMIEAIRAENLKAISDLLFNAFEAQAEQEFPQISKLKEKALKAGALGALMSGSGPSVFALAFSKKEAEKIAAILKSEVNRVTLATPCQMGLEIIE